MPAKDITHPADLYAAMMDATTPDQRDHHASDLYIKVTDATAAIIDRYTYSAQVERFYDQTDPRRALWYCIPFAYLPYWQGERG